MARWLHAEGGVAYASGDFGTDRPDFSNANPGTYGVDYIYETRPAAFTSLRARGIDLVRLAFRWERVQPTLGGPLEPQEVGRLRQVAAAAEQAGVELILDLHNYGRYIVDDGGRRDLVLGSDDLPAGALADVWARLSKSFAGTSSIAAYGLMNEPHDLAASRCGSRAASSACTWERASRSAVRAIRATGDDTLVMVGGDDWSAASRWDRTHPRAWLADDLGPVRYEAHQYFDDGGRGFYEHGFDEEHRRAAGAYPGSDDPVTRGALDGLAVFTDWLERNDAAGYIGEVGWPGADDRWNRVGTSYLDAAADAGLWLTYWSAGPWWGDYPLTAYDVDDHGRLTPRAQAHIVECYPTCGWAIRTSAHGGLAPDARGLLPAGAGR